ncbi:MAG: hypothetical protein Sylvanvirus4_14 [Sylvanvirus sp.]|uniref:Uncharacterized protein n=1 Tax=Sylvanvirus sp. TaxID=2487774 RepID=A0A3G5AHG3_9VIRU|nr:MAG: hypothetical protein Sylvanvirus4_14 [Sylvanvirus sp.]
MQRASALSLSLQHVYQERPYMEWKEWKDSKRVTEVYGVGIVWYQRYHESLQLLCIYLSTISLVSLIPHFVQGTIPFEGQVVYDVYEMNNQTVSLTDATGSGVADVAFLLTTGSYKPETIPYIYAYMTLFLLGLVIHPYLYLRYLTNNHPSVSEDPFYEDPFDHDELYLRDEKDWDIQEDAKHNEGMIGIQLVNEIQPVDSITSASMPLSITDRAQQWSCSKYKRNLLSIFVFILILVVYGVCLWVLQSNLYNSFYQQESTSSLSVHIGISLLLSVIQASTDFLWMMVCEGLRKIEQHNNQ